MILTISDGEERIFNRVLDVLEDASQVMQPSDKEEMVLFRTYYLSFPVSGVSGEERDKSYKFRIWGSALFGAASPMCLYEETDPGSGLERRNRKL